MKYDRLLYHLDLNVNKKNFFIRRYPKQGYRGSELTGLEYKKKSEIGLAFIWSMSIKSFQVMKVV